jgi:hypothetical protein
MIGIFYAFGFYSVERLLREGAFQLLRANMVYIYSKLLIRVSKQKAGRR